MATDYYSKLNITPEFLKEYEGKYIYDTGTEKRYKVAGGSINPIDIEAANQEWLAANNLRWGQYGSGGFMQDYAANEYQLGESGLAPVGKSSYATKEAYRYINQNTPEYQAAEANRFGLGPVQTSEEAANNARVAGIMQAQPEQTLAGPAESAVSIASANSNVTPETAKYFGMTGTEFSAARALEAAGGGTLEAPKTPTETPTEAGKQFYRVGTDIFDASTNERITKPDWEANWTGRATEVDAPGVEEIEEPGAKKVGNTDVTSTDILANLGIADTKDSADYMNQVLNTSEFKYFADILGLKKLNTEAQAAATVDYLDTKYASDKDALEQTLADRGLAFSGIRGSQVRSLASNLAASKLDIDRQLANKLLDFDETFVGTLMDMITDKVQEAKDGRKEALGILADNGLTISPITGELVPNLAARKEGLTYDSSTGQWTDTETAETKHSPIYTEWQDYRNTGGDLSFNDYMTMDANRKAVRIANTYNIQSEQGLADIANINNKMQTTRGSDGYYDTRKYLEIRNQVATQHPKLLDWFDDTYNPKIALNPYDPTNPYKSQNFDTFYNNL